MRGERGYFLCARGGAGNRHRGVGATVGKRRGQAVAVGAGRKKPTDEWGPRARERRGRLQLGLMGRGMSEVDGPEERKRPR